MAEAAVLAGLALNAALTAAKRSAVKPLQVTIKSESKGFTISPYTVTSGKILAIRVQDIVRGIWYNWDASTGAWDKTPISVYVGSKTLYIAAAAVNVGNAAGSLTLTITDDTGKTLASKTQTVQPWNGSYTAPNDYIGVETGSIDMPNRSYGITVSVTP